jgi:rubrerythrin
MVSEIPHWDFEKIRTDAADAWRYELGKIRISAMEKEQNLEKTLRRKAKQIIDPGVREIFEQMAKASQQHYQIVESEYARMMGMPHETDIDTFVRE